MRLSRLLLEHWLSICLLCRWDLWELIATINFYLFAKKTLHFCHYLFIQLFALIFIQKLQLICCLLDVSGVSVNASECFGKTHKFSYFRSVHCKMFSIWVILHLTKGTHLEFYWKRLSTVHAHLCKLMKQLEFVVARYLLVCSYLKETTAT